MMLPESGTRKGIGRSRSQRRKSEVMCSRSRSGRPYPLRRAPSPQDFPFPLDLYPIARQEGIQREKVWPCPVRQDRAVHRRSDVWRVLNWPRCRGLRWTHSAFLLHSHHLFPLDIRKYMLISIYYVDYGIIS